MFKIPRLNPERIKTRAVVDDVYGIIMFDSDFAHLIR